MFAHFNKSLCLFPIFLTKYHEMRGNSRLLQRTICPWLKRKKQIQSCGQLECGYILCKPLIQMVPCCDPKLACWSNLLKVASKQSCSYYLTNLVSICNKKTTIYIIMSKSSHLVIVYITDKGKPANQIDKTLWVTNKGLNGPLKSWSALKASVMSGHKAERGESS